MFVCYNQYISEVNDAQIYPSAPEHLFPLGPGLIGPLQREAHVRRLDARSHPQRGAASAQVRLVGLALNLLGEVKKVNNTTPCWLGFCVVICLFISLLMFVVQNLLYSCS